MDTMIEVRVARLEEKIEQLKDSYVQTRLVHEDLKQDIDLINISLAHFTERFSNIDSSLVNLQAGITKLDGAVGFVVKLVIGSVLVALLGLVITGSIMHAK